MKHQKLAFVLIAGLFSPLAATALTITESGLLELEKTWTINGTGSLAYNAFDGFAYVGERTGGAVYRLENDETTTQIGTSFGGVVAGLASDPVTGDVYATNDFEGGISRFDASNGWAATLVINNLIIGDDDTAGIFILPPSYTGTLAQPGEGLVTDRNNAGDDFLFSFANPASPADAHTSTQLARSNSQPAANPVGFPTPNGNASAWVDVTASNTAVYLVDDGQETGDIVGQLYTVTDAGEFLPILDDASPIDEPRGIATPLDHGLLYVTDRSNDALYAVDPTTGDETLLATGITSPFWGSIAINPEGTRLWVSESGAVYEFAIIPEPSSLALIVGLGALTLRRRR